MYGTREAAAAWESKVRKIVDNIGFSVCLANPCIFKHHKYDIETMVHGDDFISWGRRELTAVVQGSI